MTDFLLSSWQVDNQLAGKNLIANANFGLSWQIVSQTFDIAANSDKPVIIHVVNSWHWILPSGLIQYTWDGPLYILRGHRL